MEDRQRQKERHGRQHVGAKRKGRLLSFFLFLHLSALQMAHGTPVLEKHSFENEKRYTEFEVTLPILLTLGTCSVGVCFLNVWSHESKSLTSESFHSASYCFFLLFVTGKWSRPKEPAAPGCRGSLPERGLRRVPEGAAQGRCRVICSEQPGTRLPCCSCD